MTWENITCESCGKAFANLDLTANSAQCPYCNQVCAIAREALNAEEPATTGADEIALEEVASSPPPGSSKTARNNARKAVAALVLGIVSLALFWSVFFWIPTATAGAALAAGIGKDKNPQTRRRARTSLILCGIALVLAIVWALYIYVL